MRHSAEKLVCSTQLVLRSHPRNHPSDPPEHLERSVGLRPSRGRPSALAGMFLITGGGEGVHTPHVLYFAPSSPLHSARAVAQPSGKQCEY